MSDSYLENLVPIDLNSEDRPKDIEALKLMIAFQRRFSLGVMEK